MSLSGLTGLATSTNAAYKTRKGIEKNRDNPDSDYDSVVIVHGQLHVPQTQLSGDRDTQEEVLYAEPIAMPGK